MEHELVARLCKASVSKFSIPERDIEWSDAIASDHCLVPAELISIWGLSEYAELSPEQRARLARHEVACLMSFAIRLESLLIENFSDMVRFADPDALWIPYVLHEMEEEARHSRMFSKLIDVLGVGTYPLLGLLGVAERALTTLTRSRAFFMLLTLAAEELPDFFFRSVANCEDSHPILNRVSRIHRQEEARHIHFGHAFFADLYADAGATERALIRVLAAPVVRLLFDGLVRPEVYTRSNAAPNAAAAWLMWRRAVASGHRRGLRVQAASKLVGYLQSVQVIDRTTLPLWRANGLIGSDL